MRVTTVREQKCSVTGAASGIGKATALAAAREGAQLFLTDLNASALEDVVRCVGMRAVRAISRTVLCLSVGLSAAACSPSDGDPASQGQASEPGRYFMFRTFDTGNPPTQEQTQRCHAFFGSPRDTTVAIELDAGLFSFEVDPRTGRLVTEQAQRIGPGYICAAPSSRGNSIDAYAFGQVAGFPEFEMSGPCDLVPVLAEPGAAFFNCKLNITPNPEKGIAGGFATSNSIINPGDVPGYPTGSVWTAYMLESGS